MQGRSLLKWPSKLLQRTIIKKEERSDAPASHPLAENTRAAEALPANPPAPAILQGPGTDLPDTPPPSYEDACFGTYVASIIRAVAVAVAMPGAQRSQDTRIGQIVEEAVAQADYKLARLKQLDNSLDIAYISSRLRQLCDFAACRVAEDCERHPKANVKERRQKTHREIEMLFTLVFATVDWKRQGGKRVVGIATCALRETANQVLVGNEHPNYWQAGAGVHLMVSVIFRTGGLILERLAADKDLAQSFADVADLSVKTAKSFTAVAKPMTPRWIINREYARF